MIQRPIDGNLIKNPALETLGPRETRQALQESQMWVSSHESRRSALHAKRILALSLGLIEGHETFLVQAQQHSRVFQEALRVILHVG
jgi:hypothetical protein